MAFHKKLWKRGMGVLLAAAMVAGGVTTPIVGGQNVIIAQAATTINSMAYYSSNDGPVLSSSGVGEASYGFVMPIFNGGSATWEDVSSDLSVKVKVNGSYTDIDNVSSFVYNQNWGHWNDGGFTGYWFKVSQTTDIQLYSKATGVSLDYTLQFTNINTTTITSMTATDGPELTAGPTGSIGFTYPIFNGDSSIPYAAVKDDLKVYVKTVNSSEWVDIDNNAASGWIYDNNFGQFTDGPGGYWFTLTESINVKLQSKSSGASLVYTLNYTKENRSSNAVSAYDGTTTYTADDNGAVGFPLPKIGGTYAYQSDLDKFVYEVKINGRWVELSNYSESTFSYQGNGFNNMSDKNQWGYWVDYIYGLWFQPLQQDYELRIGYPENGVAGGAINNNYVYYTLIGNPNAERPQPPVDNFQMPVEGTTDLDGYNLIFNDEFTGNSLDTSVWNYVTGYYINDDPGTWGWGNNEMEYYTDSAKNVNVSNGVLNLNAYEEPKSFPQDPSRYAQYSSGKITTKDNFAFKYGRIDFSAKLPVGNGMWPALWLLPNDDTYGTWAASGEIDVMEARGRIPGASSGAIHFGGAWPANTYIGGDYAFENGGRIDTDFHLYSVVWEADMIKWYVDGNLFFYAKDSQWYTTASSASGAPFDQEFYIIMNLAVGGWFDGGITPDSSDLPANMQVDYVRVYEAEGDTLATHSGGKTTGSGSSQTEPTNPTVAVTGISMDQTDVTLSAAGQTTILSKTITPSNATNKNVTWTSSNPSVATVSAGQVTAVANGTTIITATTKDGNFSATCKVTVSIQEEVTNPEPQNPVKDHVGDDTTGLNREDGTVTFYVNGATFADLHYKVNNGGQMNVGMKNDGSGNFTYTVSGLNVGDTLDYFFTYNPGNGALDSAWQSYTLTSEGTTTTDPGNEPEKEPEKEPEQTQPSKPVDTSLPTFYEDINYGGWGVSLDLGEYNLSQMQANGIPNDSISSLKVPFGYKVTIYRDDNFQGASRVVTSDTSWIGSENNDWVSSMKIEKAVYTIKSNFSGKVLDVSGWSTDNGANLIQWDSANGANQKWYIDSVDDGYYKITSLHSGKVIDVSDVSKENGANVHMWEYVGGANQQWAINDLGNGLYSIVSRNSNKCLDVAEVSPNAGANIHQWEYVGGANQQWYLLVE